MSSISNADVCRFDSRIARELACMKSVWFAPPQIAAMMRFVLCTLTIGCLKGLMILLIPARKREHRNLVHLRIFRSTRIERKSRCTFQPPYIFPDLPKTFPLTSPMPLLETFPVSGRGCTRGRSKGETPPVVLLDRRKSNMSTSFAGVSRSSSR